MEKAKVYFTDFHTEAFGDSLPTKLQKLLKKAGIGQIDMDGKFVAIKMHFGEPGNLVIGGRHYDTGRCQEAEKKDRGSIIILIATDLPLNERQLARVAKRSMIALGRVGSYCGNGSGDIAIAFSTANRLPHYSDRDVIPVKMFYDEHIDMVFEAAAEAVEEAIVSSLYHADTMIGIRGNTYMGLREFLATIEPRKFK